MKISFKGTLAVVQAENVEETVTLIRLATGGGQKPKEGKKTNTHKKHLFKKTCDWVFPDGSVCGRKFKGTIGLAIHKQYHLNGVGNRSKFKKRNLLGNN